MVDNCGIISLETIEELIHMRVKQLYLEKHENKIWQGKNGKWYTTTLIDNNVEDSLIMSQMGHTDISTTRKYYYFANKNDEYKRMQIENSIGNLE